MAEARLCPECRAELTPDAPEGLCPQCLLSFGIADVLPASPPSGSTTPHPGTFVAPAPAELAGCFPQLEILELLGQGGMGAVYKARQVKLDRVVAVKVLPSEWGRDPAFAERFAREARALARLNHAHIVAVHDFGESDGLFYLVMEYVDGLNLRQLLQAGRVRPDEALAVVSQVCDALQYAHEEGVIHRDIKPENILLDAKGRVKIADFGLAKLLGVPRAAFTLTGSRQVMGTLDYMAPEQRNNPQEVDHRADIYSLGVVFYEMLTGELPLGRFTPPSQKAAVDRRLDEVVFRALETDPGRRFQRVSQVKAEVEQVAGAPAAPRLDERQRPAQPAEWNVSRISLIGPAAGIMLTGLVAFVQWLVGVGALFVLGFHEKPGLFAVYFLLALLGLAVMAAASGVLVLGGLKMLRMESYSWAVVGAVWAMVPWSYGWLIGLPFGIWALIVLRRPEVRAAFFGGSMPAAPRIVPARPRGEGGVDTGLLAIPVKLWRAVEGWYQDNGLLRLEADALVLEYESGRGKSKVHQATIPINLVKSLQLKSGWFLTRLVIQTASWKVLDGVPGNSRGQVYLAIARGEVESVKRLMAAVGRMVPGAVRVGSIAPPAPEIAPVVAPPPPRPAAQAQAPQPGLLGRKIRSLLNSARNYMFDSVAAPLPPTTPPVPEEPAPPPPPAPPVALPVVIPRVEAPAPTAEPVDEAPAVLRSAVGLMIVGGLSLLWSLLYLAIQVLEEARGNPYDVVAGFNIPLAILVIVGGWRMMRLKGYALALVASGLALVPATPAALLGIPAGIWALLVLTNPRVKAAFPQPTGPVRVHRVFFSTTTWVIVLCVAGALVSLFAPWFQVMATVIGPQGAFPPLDHTIPPISHRFSKDPIPPNQKGGTPMDSWHVQTAFAGGHTWQGMTAGLVFLILIALQAATSFLDPMPVWRPVLLMGGALLIVLLAATFESSVRSDPAVAARLAGEMPAFSVQAWQTTGVGGVPAAGSIAFGVLILGALQLRSALRRQGARRSALDAQAEQAYRPAPL